MEERHINAAHQNIHTSTILKVGGADPGPQNLLPGMPGPLPLPDST